ncbi:MAG TPA: type II CAAX endopeptidase family protein [Anaerolineales bacterium]|nr:type II CAAX endopeptidase family protein [Anaerolineales bacterium]
MSTPTAIQQSAPPSALRRLVARHPVAAFLTMAYTITSAFALPPIRTRLDILPPELPLWDVLATIFGVGLPAFLVVAAAEGRTGVRDLGRRCLRWRVGVRWYFVALLGIPIAALLCASVIFGQALLNALVEKWPLLFTLVLPRFLIRVVLFQFFEEAGWMGFLQARLQDRYGPLKAVVLAEIPFALWHLPSVMIELGLGIAQLPLALGLLGILAIFQLFGRVVIMWLYNNTHRSVLLVVLFHSSHNITTGELGREFIPGWSEGSALLITSGVVALAAMLIIVFTRGRLSYTLNQEMDERRN